MHEFLLEIVNPANLLATTLLGGVLLYWLLVIFGAVGMDALEIDLDMDADGDLDLEFADGLFGTLLTFCLLYTSPSPRDKRQSRMPSSA